MSSYTSDDSTEIGIRVHRRERSPGPGFRRVPPPPPNPHGPPHFIQTVTRDVRDHRPTGYYHPPGIRRPEEHMTIVHRARSRERRSPPVHGGPPPPPAAPQVVIQQPYVDRRRMERDSDSSSDESSHASRRHRRHHRHRSHSRARSRSSSRHSFIDDFYEKQRLQRMREELDAIHLETRRKEEQRQLEIYSKEQAALAQTRAELEMRKQREEDELRNDRYRDEYELIALKREIARIRHQEEELKAKQAHDAQAKLAKDSDELARLKRQQEEQAREKQLEEEREYQKSKTELERRKREEEEARRSKAQEDEAKAKAALAELDRIRAAEKKKEEEERIRREMELKKLEEEKKAAEEAKRKEKEAEEAIAAWKAKEAEREAKEKAEKEAYEKEFQRRMQEQLIASGVDEKDIAAIMKKEKIKQERQQAENNQLGRPTYTRMSLRHLDIETLYHYKIEFEMDPDPGYVLIKRWVPEWEQNMLWDHTRSLRIVTETRVRRTSGDPKIMLEVKDGGHRHHRHRSGEYEFVRPKSRHRSKSPGLLMYLAGGRPR